MNVLTQGRGYEFVNFTKTQVIYYFYFQKTKFVNLKKKIKETKERRI